MSFSNLTGNERSRHVLQRLLDRGRIGGTMIFAGPEGVGKRQFALMFAKSANCLKPGPAGVFANDCCDQCSNCRRIDSATFGDVTPIQPDGQFIKIAQTRAMAEDVYYRPREGRQKFYIIDRAEALREEAANSLLKTLEEPPPTSTIILITSRPDSLLQTIRSRSQRLNFTPLTIPQMEKFLNQHYPRPAEDNALLARITEGRIGQATAFDLSVYRQQRKSLIEILDLIASGDNRYRLIKAAEYLGKKERDEFEKDLELLARLMRDMLLLASGAQPDAIVNLDAADRLQPLAIKIGLDRLILWIEKFNQLRSNLRVNINRQIATEAAFLQLAGKV